MTKPTYAGMLQVIRDQIAEHNNVVGDESARLDAAPIIAKLQQAPLVYTTVDALTKCSWETLQTCGLPEGLAKAVAGTWRTGSGEPRTTNPSVIGVLSMDDRDLLKNYDPNNPNTPAARQIRTRFGPDGLCIAFTSEGKVHVEASLLAMKSIAVGEKRETITHDGQLFDLYPVGANPNELATLHPLLKGQVLGVDGTDSFGFSWGEVLEPVRQFLMVGVDLGEIAIPGDRRGMQELYREAIASDAIQAMQRVYTKTRAEYARRLSLGVGGLPCTNAVRSQGKVRRGRLGDDAEVLEQVLSGNASSSSRLKTA